MITVHSDRHRKLPRKGKNYETQTSQGTERRSDRYKKKTKQGANFSPLRVAPILEALILSFKSSQYEKKKKKKKIDILYLYCKYFSCYLRYAHASCA